MATESIRTVADEKKQRITTAAKAVFLKFGYGRVTMHDLASAAGISRPALYLVFSKKEDIFSAVVRELTNEIAAEVDKGLGKQKTPISKLKFVCEVWMIQTFDWANQSEESKEIYESSHEFAREAVVDGIAAFENYLVSAITLMPKYTLPKDVSEKLAAHILAGSIVGVKSTCKSSSEFRTKVHTLIDLLFDRDKRSDPIWCLSG